jgi:hypothetical protein
MSTAARLDNAEPGQVPPLENGDRLTRDEFERRYWASPHIKKAELIEGVVYVASRVNFGKHGRPHWIIMGWLAQYADSHPRSKPETTRHSASTTTMNRSRTRSCATERVGPPL